MATFRLFLAVNPRPLYEFVQSFLWMPQPVLDALIRTLNGGCAGRWIKARRRCHVLELHPTFLFRLLVAAAALPAAVLVIWSWLTGEEWE